MATRAKEFIAALDHNGNQRSGCYLIRWSGLQNGDDGEPVCLADYPDKTVQVLGTFGAGGNARIEGTNNHLSSTSGDYAALNDAQGNALNLGDSRVETVLENPDTIRPRVTAGDGTTDLIVTMLVSTVARR